MNILDRFKKVNDEYLKFHRVENKKSTARDVHAFILLTNKFKITRDIIASAAHDEIYLDVSDNEIPQLTDDEILELVRCGVCYNESNGLYMNV